MIDRRLLAVAAGLAARAGLLRAYAVWPNATMPMVAAEPAGAAPAWLWDSFEAGTAAAGPPGGISSLGRRLSRGTWAALRSRSSLLGSPPPWLMEAFESAVGGDLEGSSVALYSRTGSSLSKVMLFLFPDGEAEPAALAIAMADPSQAPRLRREFDRVATIRRSLEHAPDLAAALPLEPLFAGDAGPEYLVVLSPDPLAAATGAGEATDALAWLRGFQAATTGDTSPWGEADDETELASVRQAWQALRPDGLPGLESVLKAQLAGLRGCPVPRCVVHGDFWRGNIAQAGACLRVYDWEWAELEGTPFFDLWTYEFGELLDLSRGGSLVVSELRGAQERIEDELGRRDLDPRFAALTLASSAALIAIRMRLTTGAKGPAEDAMAGIMASSELVLEAS